MPNMVVFWKFVRLSFGFYHRSLTSLAMALVIPLGFLLVSCFTYFSSSGASAILVGVSTTVSPALLEKLELTRMPGLQILPIIGTAEDNVRDGKISLVISQDSGKTMPSIYSLEQNRAIADIVSVALSTSEAAVPAYDVRVTSNGSRSFAFLPGLIIMSITNLAFFTTGAKLLQDRAAGTLRLYRLFPTPLYVFFAAELSTKLVLGVVQSMFFILLGNYLLELNLAMSTILASTLISGLCAFCLLSMGIALGSNLRTYSSGIHVFTILNLLMVFMGDVMFPNSGFPATRAIAFILPTTHCVNLLRHVMLDYPPSFDIAISLTYMLAFTALMTLVTLRNFRYTAGE